MDKEYKSNMREERDLTPYESYYHEDAFWEKLKAFGKKAGIKLVYGALQEAGVEIPFPQRDIHIITSGDN